MWKSFEPATTSEVKQLAFPVVHDTKSIVDPTKKRDSLYNRLNRVFSEHYVGVLIFEAASTASRKEYESDVDIIFS